MRSNLGIWVVEIILKYCIQNLRILYRSFKNLF